MELPIGMVSCLLTYCYITKDTTRHPASGIVANIISLSEKLTVIRPARNSRHSLELLETHCRAIVLESRLWDAAALNRAKQWDDLPRHCFEGKRLVGLTCFPSSLVIAG